MNLFVVTAPAVEPVTVAEAKMRAGINSSNQEPAPWEPLTVALTGVAGNVDNGVRRYSVTFRTTDGETTGSPVSDPVTVSDKTVDGKVSVSAIPVGGSAVTSRKLYRTAAGGSTYLLLATIADNTTTTYTDNIADASLGAGMPAVNTTLDPDLARLIVVARRAAEKHTRRAFVTQTWELQLDEFPCADGPLGYWKTDEILLPRPPLQSVSWVKYVDTNGVLQTLSSALYDVDTKAEPARIRPVYGTSWPSIRYGMASVQIRFVAGYGLAAAVPEDVKEWMLLKVGTAWRNPSTMEIGERVQLVETPDSYADGLLDDYIVYARIYE